MYKIQLNFCFDLRDQLLLIWSQILYNILFDIICSDIDVNNSEAVNSSKIETRLLKKIKL